MNTEYIHQMIISHFLYNDASIIHHITGVSLDSVIYLTDFDVIV